MSLARTCKEFARHLLFRAGYRRELPYLRGDRQGSFSAIYDQKAWTLGDAQVPLSGNGSSLAATAGLRDQLAGVLAQIGTTRLLDVGCGDFTWMQHVQLPCDYIGIDIVPSVIENNRLAFASPTRSFAVVDFVAEKPPAADTILCREVLFHLCFGDILAGLNSALAMGCKFLLLTSDVGTSFNADIRSGDFRVLNLEKPPFRLPPPMLRIDDSAVQPGRFIGIWTAEAIRKAIG